jgi:hypothetical protein
MCRGIKAAVRVWIDVPGASVGSLWTHPQECCVLAADVCATARRHVRVRIGRRDTRRRASRTHENNKHDPQDGAGGVLVKVSFLLSSVQYSPTAEIHLLYLISHFQ